MNEMQLLQRWPGWAGRTAKEIMDSPAWSMRTRWGDDEVRLRFSDNRPRDVLALKIAFDDEEHFLGIGEREAFPDLAALWDRKSDLPGALMLALVEKECGKLLQLLENAVRRQLRVIGLAEASEREGSRGMEVVGADGGIVASFALEVSPLVAEAFGDISAIDASHASVRAMTRPAAVEYAVFSLGAESSALASGDFLLVPELDNPAAARWCVDDPEDDGKFHLRSVSPVEVEFAAFADGQMPEVPDPEALDLYLGSKKVASGRAARLGSQSAFAVEEVL
jgi:hypothetical protein